MTRKYIIIRRGVKLKFIEFNKDLFHKLFLTKQELKKLYPNDISKVCRAIWSCDEHKKIAEIARKNIGYSCKTSSVDIVHNMLLKYEQLFINNK